VAARVLTAIVVASSAAARAGAQATTLEARLGAVLDDVIAAHRLPGATAAVSVDGRVVAVARGFADRERRIPMTPSHRMLVGSAGKPFFAFVAVSAAHERGIDLDTPVAQWLGAEPWFARLPNANRITLWHLLARVPAADRDRVFDRLATFVAPPAGVTREGVRAGDKQMLDAWWDALGLGSTSLWRKWSQQWREP